MLQRRPSREKALKEALPSEAAGLNSDTMLLGNFEEQQQLKTRLDYINYAFVLLSWCFCRGGGGVALIFSTQQL